MEKNKTFVSYFVSRLRAPGNCFEESDQGWGGRAAGLGLLMAGYGVFMQSLYPSPGDPLSTSEKKGEADLERICEAVLLGRKHS